MNTKTPAWFSSVPADRRRIWTAGDSKMKMRDALEGFQMRLVLTNGTTIEGTYNGDKNFWGKDADYSVALKVEGRKTNKWVSLAMVTVAHFDAGPSLGALVGDYIENQHEREEAYLGTIVG